LLPHLRGILSAGKQQKSLPRKTPTTFLGGCSTEHRSRSSVQGAPSRWIAFPVTGSVIGNKKSPVQLLQIFEI